MSGPSTWPPALLFALGAVLGALLVALLRAAAQSRRRSDTPTLATLSFTSQALLEAVPIPTVVFSDSMRPLFHNTAYEDHPAMVRRVLEKEWLQRTVMRALVEGKGVSRRSDPDDQQSVHVVPLPENLVAVMVWDESDLYSADAMRQDFIANASHELNTPVSAILLLSEALQKGSSDKKATGEFVKALHGEAERLSELTRDIGRLAEAQDRSRTEKLEPIDTIGVVDEVVMNHLTLASAAQVRLEWNRASAPESLRVEIDPKMLEVALGNIVENAIKHSPAGGSVRIGVRETGPLEEAIVSISDQGPGIEPEQADKIFQRFYRVDKVRGRQSGGTGLGLAIARNVARGAGGDISVKSVPGEGATFLVTLPLAPPPVYRGEGEEESK
ncbi:HAMP domain-containing sensor histidine kinase [Actinomycetaceae bacterium MB13-C1-2]|nr:HAMP domain-containing sensor histidine kinase [Actinomycetaceae bacterium MB13-C1-2]